MIRNISGMGNFKPHSIKGFLRIHARPVVCIVGLVLTLSPIILTK